MSELHRITGGPEPKAPFLIGLSGSKHNARTATDPPFGRVFVPTAGISEERAALIDTCWLGAEQIKGRAFLGELIG